jgi:hypothetical protein
VEWETHFQAHYNNLRSGWRPRAHQAKQAGGTLVILWGNHEVCNATGDFLCTRNGKAFSKTFNPVLNQWKGNKPKIWSKEYRDGASKYAACFAAFEPGGPLSEPFLLNLKVVVQV